MLRIVLVQFLSVFEPPTKLWLVTVSPCSWALDIFRERYGRAYATILFPSHKGLSNFSLRCVVTECSAGHAVPASDFCTPALTLHFHTVHNIYPSR